MDQPGLSLDQHRQALRGLERLNQISRSAAILWSVVGPHMRRHPNRPWSILDVASGGGDVTLELWRRANRQGLTVALTGYDQSPTAVEYATQRSGRYRDSIRFHVRDVFDNNDLGHFDIVVNSCFLHHLSEPSAVGLLQRMSMAATELLVVNDLERSRLAYAATLIATRMLSRSHIVRTDGPNSIAAAFTSTELVELARRAELRSATVTSRPIFRLLLAWQREPILPQI